MTSAIVLFATQPAVDSDAQAYESLIGLVNIAKMGAAFVGGYFGCRLLLRRNRKLRQRAFMSLMTELKCVVLHVWPRGDFVIHYRNTIQMIVGAAAPVLADFNKGKGVELQRMINDLCRHTNAETQSKLKQISEDIDAITRFFASEV